MEKLYSRWVLCRNRCYWCFAYHARGPKGVETNMEGARLGEKL